MQVNRIDSSRLNGSLLGELINMIVLSSQNLILQAMLLIGRVSNSIAVTLKGLHRRADFTITKANKQAVTFFLVLHRYELVMVRKKRPV